MQLPWFAFQLFLRFWTPLLSIQKHLQASINYLPTFFLSLESLVATIRTARPRAMDLSSDLLSSPPGSSLFDIDLLDPGETLNNVFSPTLPTSDTRPTAVFTLDSHSNDSLTSNPLFLATERSAAIYRLGRIPNKKRGLSSLAFKLAFSIDKTSCFDFTSTPNTSFFSSVKDTIL